MAPWTGYRGSPYKPHARLTAVSHVTHLDVAARLLRDWRLRAGPVYDESKLNQERIHVVWVSPNDWVDGSRYGNVRFTFDWKNTVAGKNIYWVEAIDKYKPPATRFLLTEVDRSGNKLLLPYDPKVDDGPWVIDGDGNHLWNSDICLEVMVERTIPLGEAVRIDFVRHHPDMCCNGSVAACPDADTFAAQATARFVARAALDGPKKGAHPLVGTEGGDADASLLGWWLELLSRLYSNDLFSGRVVAGSPPAVALARAVLGAIGRGDQDWHMIAALFASREDMLASVRDIVEGALALAAHLPVELPD